MSRFCVQQHAGYNWVALEHRQHESEVPRYFWPVPALWDCWVAWNCRVGKKLQFVYRLLILLFLFKLSRIYITCSVRPGHRSMGFADHNVDLSQTSIRVQPLPNTLPLIEIGLRDGEQSLNKENFQKGKSSLSIIKFHSIESRKYALW